MAKKLNDEGIGIGRGRMRRRTKSLALIVRQRKAYKVTTKRDKRAGVADKFYEQTFQPSEN